MQTLEGEGVKEVEMEGEKEKVCVTGGTGYVASWLIMKLLQNGCSVNTTIRSSLPGHEKDISYLKNLPGASERLRIFNADLDKPDSFNAPIEGCIGVFHVAHPLDFTEKEETLTKRSINGTIGILQACLDSKTVKKVVYTSSVTTVMFDGKDFEVKDEESWTDVDYVRSLNTPGASYFISKTSTERAVLEFAERHGLDLVTLNPSFIHGPFITPHCPGSIRSVMTMIFGDNQFAFNPNNAFVHVDDVANAHIFLLDYPDAKGRYICSAVEITDDELYKFLAVRYPQYLTKSADSSLKKAKDSKYISFSSKKLLDTGFKYKYGLEEMYDEAIQCCKEKGLL